MVAARVSSRGSSQGRTRRRESLSAALFLLPALVLLVLFRLAPVLIVARDSVFIGQRFVGLDNFTFLFDSSAFRASLLTTLQFNLIINPVQILIAFGLALVLTDGARRAGLWQTLNLLPIAVPLAVSAVVWGVALRPDDGIVNAVLDSVGIPAQPWLTSPDQAMWAIIIMASWVGVGYWSLFLVSGLKQIPPSLTGAAAVDGAGYWRNLVSIRLPLMRRPLAFVLVADTVVNLLLFAPVQILTRGGPQGSTNLVMFDVFRTAFILNDKALASAETLLLIVVVLLIVAFQFRLLGGSDLDGSS
jgi:multiple sugar transport system permease protein